MGVIELDREGDRVLVIFDGSGGCRGGYDSGQDNAAAER